MKHLNFIAALVAAIAIMSAAPADAQSEKSKAGKAMQDRSQDVADRAETERDRLVPRDKKSREQIEDAMEDETADVDDEDTDDDYMGEDDVANDGVRDKSGKAKDKSAKMKDKSAKGLDNAATRGNEKSQEMRARRDERKVIKEEYKASGKAGDGDLDADDVLDADADEASEEGLKNEKKPWWKFWNQ